MNYLFYIKRQLFSCVVYVSAWLITHGIMRHFGLTYPITRGQVMCGIVAAFTHVFFVSLYIMYFDSLKNKN
jgi:hypothetical protein